MADSRPSSQKTLTSPRLDQLRSDLRAGSVEAALDTFWHEVGRHGTPLIEEIDGDQDHRLVTFLWRDTETNTENVVVVGGPAHWWDLRANTLENLPNTDLWHATFRARSDLRGRYVLCANDSLGDLPDEGTPEYETRWANFLPDPLNPNVFVWPKHPVDPNSSEEVESILELPDAPKQPWLERRHGVARGNVEEHTFRSTVLKNERSVWVYQPADHVAVSGHLPLLVLFDGFDWMHIEPTIVPTLDNLIAEGVIPPMVVVLPDALDFKTRSRELPCHELLLPFLQEELLPWARQRWNVTSNPAHSIVSGRSYGGLAAAFVGLRIPKVFGNVLSQSGSFWWKAHTEYDLEAEILTRRFAQEPRVPVRFWLEVGLQEGSYMLPTNRHLRDVLDAKGYDVSYREYNGGHDQLCWRGSLADGLRSLTAAW